MIKVSYKTLLVETALLWLIASFILIIRAFGWALDMNNCQLAICIPIGLLLSVIKTKFVFKKLTDKNIKRLLNLKESGGSIFDFHVLKDKILIIIMIGLGIILRSATFIPKWCIMPVYMGIGFAMFYVFIVYVRAYVKTKH